MTATVTWSSNLRLAVKNFKEMKAIPSREIFHEHALTSVEEQAIQKQLSQKSEDFSIKSYWT
jgi:hypothetical protein